MAGMPEPTYTPVEDPELGLAAAEEAFGATFRREHPAIWAATLFGPFLLSAAALGAVYIWVGAVTAQKLFATAVATFFFFGKFVILGGTEPELAEAQRFFSAGQLALLVFWMDLMTASVLVLHAGYLFRIPFLGPRLLSLVADGRYILKAHPWMRRATFIGIIVFVMFPLAATGSVGASIFGRLLGMTRLSTFLGIAIGSALGCGAMYFGAELINRYLDRDNPLLFWGGIALIAAVVVLLNLRYRHLKARALEQGQ